MKHAHGKVESKKRMKKKGLKKNNSWWSDKNIEQQKIINV